MRERERENGGGEWNESVGGGGKAEGLERGGKGLEMGEGERWEGGEGNQWGIERGREGWRGGKRAGGRQRQAERK